MSRLDFLYRTELPHRAVAVYIYLADRANENTLIAMPKTG